MFVLPGFFQEPPRHQQLLVADICILGLWILRRKAQVSEWYVLGSVLAPLLFSLALSAPFTLRYFVMTHLFLLIGLAVLIWRIPRLLARTVVIAVILVSFAKIYIDFWNTLDVAHRPGSQGAANYLNGQRRPNEPVVVCMPLFYFPLLYYALDRNNYYVYAGGDPIPHYYGTAALTLNDLMTDVELQSNSARRVWIVNMANGGWGIRWIRPPSHWVERSRHAFTDVAHLGDVIVVEYDTCSRRDME
jgi:hypothetical protein